MIFQNYNNNVNAFEDAISFKELVEGNFSRPILNLRGVTTFSDLGRLPFRGNSYITELYAPDIESLPDYAFEGCSALKIVFLSNISNISGHTFGSCPIEKFYILSNAIPSVPAANPLNSLVGSIYVPASLVSSYQNTFPWSTYSSRFIGI